MNKLLSSLLLLLSITASNGDNVQGRLRDELWVHPAKNSWPVIGVFAQPSTSTAGNCGGNCQYIAASYVKYLEASGARVVPINYYSTNDELDAHFANLNGFFFTGGGSVFPAAAQYTFDKVISANKNKDFTPLWGTCMGFQWLLIAGSGDANVLDPPFGKGQMDSYNLSIPLDFTKQSSSSRIFGSAPADVLNILKTQPVTMNNHHYGIYPAHFQATPKLTSLYNILSTNKDRAGVEFVSTIEAFHYPIYGTQWHPEKNPYEWGKDSNGYPLEAINHSGDAITVAQYAASFFVGEARKSDHKYFDPSVEESQLIKNYPVTKTSGDFQETYFFNW